jgi:anti-sigma-K factor RskA
MSSATEVPSEREEIEMLLPWYATGKLSGTDRKRVEVALAADKDLRRQLEIILEDRAETIAANEAIAARSTVSAAAIVDKTSVGPLRTARAGLGRLADSMREFFSTPTAGKVKWATAAALAIVLAQAVTIGALVRDRDGGGYVTASGPTATAGDATALVRFADDATAAAISATLGRLSMSIVDGPRAGGVFRVRIGTATMSAADRAAAIERLRAQAPVVIFASPAPATSR